MFPSEGPCWNWTLVPMVGDSSEPVFKDEGETDSGSCGQGWGSGAGGKHTLRRVVPWPFLFSLPPPSAACTPTVYTLGLPDNPFTHEEATAQRGTALFPRPHSTRVNSSSRLPALHPLPHCLFSSYLTFSSSPSCIFFPFSSSLSFPFPLSSSLPVLSLEVS